MRKTTKGAIAVGAGVALLLGGAGTLAAWNVSQNIAATGNVNTGNLNLTTTTPGTWAWGDVATCSIPGTAIADITTVKIVPGDCVIYSQDIVVTATGDNLKAEATITGTPTIGGTLGAANVTVATTTTFPTPPTGVTKTGSAPDVWLFDATVPTTKTINAAAGKARVSIKFKDATAGQTGVSSTVAVSGMSIQLKQTAPTS
jgi:alternate signal-mediated exported protein